MLHSVRARLTLWYTAVLAVVLIVFSLVSYALLARAIRSATDASVAATAHEFASAYARNPAPNVPLDFRYSDREVFVFESDGRVAASTHSKMAAADRARLNEVARGTGFVTIAGGPEDDGIRVFREPIEVQGRRLTVVVAQDLDPQADRLESAAQAVLWGIPLTLLLAAASGYLLAKKSLAPVAAMSAKARQIGARTLNERITVENERDELGHLAATMNDLLERLERAFASQRDFMADASHQLRTPIAIILGEADVALSRPERSRSEYRDSMQIMQRAAGKLRRIVQNVFLLARSDAGTYPLSRTRFYLDDVVAECVHGLRTVAAARRVTIECNMDRDLVMTADEELIQHLVQNLLDNAVKFSREGGRVTVAAARENGSHVLRVKDEGPGIAAGDQPHIFNRFFRATGHHAEGAGLGLAIGRWIAESHGAALALERSDERGSTFRVTFFNQEAPAERIALAAKGEW